MSGRNNRAQGLKLFVSLFFILFALTCFGEQWLTISSAARNLAGGAEALDPPTGVSASDGDYADKVGIRWDTVRGAILYRIFRSAISDPTSAAEVGTTAANYFFDRPAQANQTFYYWVRAENLGLISTFSNAAQGRRAEGEIRGGFFSPLSPPPMPAGNPVTAAKASLGKALFWDEQLSSTLTVACGTCHRSGQGGSDPRTVIGNARVRNPGFDNIFNTSDDVFGSPGVPLNNQDGTYSPSNLYGFNEQVTARKAPSYLNSGFASAGLFWDGRASNTFRDPLTNEILLTQWGALESQVLGPPVSSAEMAHGNRNWTQVAAAVAAAKPLALASNVPPALANWINGRTYPELFQEAFGTPAVTPSRIAMAIAAHERNLFSDRTPLDRWGAGIEPLTAQENRGLEVYETVQCSTCHGGPLLSDQNFHNLGLRPSNEDSGRESVTGRAEDRARFKTPTLRNVELRAPYMHNGRFATLEEVVEFYNRGGDFDAPNIDRDVIRPLNLSVEQKADLVAFLKRPLTDSRVRDELPPFDRPRLYTESNRVPVITGTGRAGSGGITPQVVAIEPPLIGNPSFTVVVAGGAGNAQAVLVIDSNDPGIGSSIPAGGSLARVAVNLTGSGSGNGFGSIGLMIPNNPALIGQTFYGRWYITDAQAASGFAVTPAFRFTVFGEAAIIGRKTHFDFDGDGRADVSIVRPSSGTWYRLNSGSSNSFFAAQFGVAEDKIAPADYDADGKTDLAVFRPSNGVWYLQRSTAGFTAFQFGQAGDIPAPGDFDGDGKADLAVFRPSTGVWYLNRSTQGYAAVQFGQTGDIPQVGDFDGDGRADISVYRPSTGVWYRLNSSNNQSAAQQFGQPGDLADSADYDGDGTNDLAVFRPLTGVWYLQQSTDGFTAIQFGQSGDVPAAADFDGDGRADIALFRPSTGIWYLNRSSAGFSAVQFGQAGDTAVESAFTGQ